MTTEDINKNQHIIPVDIEEEMKKSFIDYAMSVIVDRALPDIRDGLKPVHRRILYSMYRSGLTPDKPYRKCATTVGDVLGSFHPHGDAAAYDSLVRMAQDFSLRYPLVDGHGNFGSRDGDPPAAMRYTEAKMHKIAMEMLADINKDTVDFQPNFDEHDFEPVVLPSRVPNLLINGSSGIAVGMATNIPPHNIGEVIDGICAFIDNPDITVDELMQYIKGPDFPTYGTIVGLRGIREAYRTGKGRIIVRANTEIVEVGNRHKIIVKDLPYLVNKARLIVKIAELVKEKRIDGIADITDESDRKEEIRISITLKKDASPNIVLNQLYKYTQMQDVFSVNMLALAQDEKGRFVPIIFNLKEAISHYVDHQVDVVQRRTRFDLEKAEARAHILEGLLRALDIIDEIIATIRSSSTTAVAKTRLIENFGFTEIQAQHIVDMRLGQLTGLEREKLQKEYAELEEKIDYYRRVLADIHMVHGIIKEELLEMKKKYGDERRTRIEIAEDNDINIEDLIEEEENVITITNFGYIKRLPCDTYKSQRRGGKGVVGLSTREEDYVVNLFTTSTHDYILFFTNKGRMFRLKAYVIPEAGRQAKGTAIVNLLELNSDERIETTIPVRDYSDGKYLMFVTKKGLVKKTAFSEYDSIRTSGLAAITLREDDELISVRLTDGNDDIILVTKNGMAIRFSENDVRPTGRTAQGVKGITLDDDDEVIGMGVVWENSTLLLVTENGFGKRTDPKEYTTIKRGGKGVRTYKITEKTGKVVGMKMVDEEDDAIMITKDGTVIRVPVKEISLLGRITMGVTLMKTTEDNQVVSLARIIPEAEEEDELNEADKRAKSGICRSKYREDDFESEDEDISGRFYG
jgi:DNA gyrase subunit A